MDKCGIYCITNEMNGKKYIGSSSRIKGRHRDHKYSLNNNKHANEHLQSSWNKYGEGAFRFDILEECNIEVLENREKAWMEYYKSLDNKYGYNIELPQKNTMSDYTRDKISNALVGRKLSKEHTGNIAKVHRKPVNQIGLDGVFIKRFNSVKEAWVCFNKSNGNQSGITQVLKGNKKTAYGYKWEYAEK